MLERKSSFSTKCKGFAMNARLLATVTIACILFGTATSHAVTVKAKSGSREDIQEAISEAPENATVVIPEGEFDFRGPRINVDKNITISGSGDKETVLKKTSALDWFFNVITEGFFRLTNIVLDGDRRGGGVQMRTDNLNFRVDNSTFRNFGTRAVQTYGDVKGLVDNNEFLENRPTDIVVYGDNDKSWNEPTKLGTDDAVYIEDNVFTHRRVKNSHSVSSNRGSKYVFRYNTINDGDQNTNPIDAHGNFYHGRGSRSYEIYGNKVNSGHSFMGMYIRGGTGVIFDNELNGSFTHPLTLENYRSFQQSNVRYPAPDQIHDLHIWDNKHNGKEVIPYMRDRGRVREHIQENRDYFRKEKADYTPYTYPHPMRGEKAAQAATVKKPANNNAGSSILNEEEEVEGTVKFKTPWDKFIKTFSVLG
ncbi:MAG: hypothetical protein ACLFTW_15230 [Chitinispirillaceae bacterium]